ncbi:hypothetical protein ACWGUL_01115 [Streptomyces albidoflavus]
MSLRFGKPEGGRVDDGKPDWAYWALMLQLLEFALKTLLGQ